MERNVSSAWILALGLSRTSGQYSIENALDSADLANIAADN